MSQNAYRFGFLSALLVALLLACAPAWSQGGKPDLVWLRGGHSSPVRSVSYSPDGKLFVSGSEDHTVKIWRVADGMLLRTIPQSGQKALFTPDSKEIIATDGSATINRWRVADGALRATISIGTSQILDCTISTDGTLLATGSKDKLVRVFRIADGTLLQTLSGFTGPAQSVSFSPDGSLIASGSSNSTYQGADNTVRIWRVSDGKSTLVIPVGFEAGSYQVIFTPDGQSIVVGETYADNNQVVIYRISDGILLRAIGYGDGGVSSIALSRDGTTLAIAERQIEVWRISDNRIISLISHPYYSNPVVAFSPDGRTLSVGNTDVVESGPAVAFYDSANGSFQREFTPPGAGGPVTMLETSPTQPLFITRNQQLGDMLLCRTSDGAVVNDFATSIGPDSSLGVTDSIKISPDGAIFAMNYLNMAYGKTGFQLRRFPDGMLIRTVPSYRYGGVVFSPDGKLLVTGNADDVWRVSDGVNIKHLALPELPGRSRNECFTPDSALFIRGEYTLDIYRVSDWTFLRTIRLPLDPGERMTSLLSPNNHLLVVGTRNGKVLIYDADTGNLFRSTSVNGAVNALAISPDGAVMAGVTTQGFLYLWRLSDLTLLATYDKETASIKEGYGGNSGLFSVSFSANGQYIFCGRADSTICCALNPFHNAIFPNHGGNTGNVTVQVTTTSEFRLIPGGAAEVRLVAEGQPDIIGQNTIVTTDQWLTTTFDLRGAPLGDRKVVILSTDKTWTQPKAFTIEQGVEPALWTEILGSGITRVGSFAKLTVLYGNSGNIDSPPGNICLTFPKGTDWNVEEDFKVLASYDEDDDSGNYSADLLSMPFGQRYQIANNLPRGSAQLASLTALIPKRHEAATAVGGTVNPRRLNPNRHQFTLPLTEWSTVTHIAGLGAFFHSSIITTPSRKLMMFQGGNTNIRHVINGNRHAVPAGGSNTLTAAVSVPASSAR